MNRELNYFPFIAVLSLGYFVGLFFPDTDQSFQLLLGHRSIITHSILLPYLLYLYFNKKNNLTPLKTILIVGIYLGIGLHLSADLHPKAFRGYALIKENYSNSEINNIKRELTVKPFVNRNFSQQANPFPVYLESKKKIYLPKHYGIQKYGKVNEDKSKKWIQL